MKLLGATRRKKIMPILCFTLSMPGCGSWNGRWSGENNLYAMLVPRGSSKVAKEKTDLILKTGYYSYSWSDGWHAGIKVRQVTSAESRKIRRLSKGFCGYEWMVKSILARNKILADHEIEPINNPTSSPSETVEGDGKA